MVVSSTATPSSRNSCTCPLVIQAPDGSCLASSRRLRGTSTWRPRCSSSAISRRWTVRRTQSRAAHEGRGGGSARDAGTRQLRDPLTSWVSDGWKLIEQEDAPPLLFDLRQDPGEQRNLAGEAVDRLLGSGGELQAVQAGMARSGAAARRASTRRRRDDSKRSATAERARAGRGSELPLILSWTCVRRWTSPGDERGPSVAAVRSPHAAAQRDA